MNDPTDREVNVFNTARRLPAGERAKYLHETCVGDAMLRQRVEELLLANQEAGDFLRGPAGGAEMLLQSAISSKAGRSTSASSLLAEKPGDRIGRYKLLEQIGEGGCGVVYMAEQEEPVRRKVALKVIKLGMDTKNVIARFEAERQALAMMDHPNIAKVLDAGATETGRPYFVMELVRGTKITDYCDENNVSTRERLQLFVQVCQAIQHAHQKGIIHRDIKPSNILVTLRDGVPVPKVIDFGIAKATTDQRLTDKTLFTQFQMFLGTPAYMSPEQAEMSEQGIDTRSDIYSLGILLYELLTGTTPFDPKQLMHAGLDETRRIIREQEPARPSNRITTMAAADLTSVAAHRQADAAKLSHLIRGELDWIVMKALEKDRTRRYETANGLAMDIQRHLNNETVVARPTGNLYRIQKFARRHKVMVFAIGAVIVALIAGLGVSNWRLAQEKAARRRAIAAERTAEAARAQSRLDAAKSEEVVEFLKNVLQSVGASVALGRDTEKLRKVLDESAVRVSQDLTNQPEVEAELRSILGSTYLKLREIKKAEAMEREALRLRRLTLGKTNKFVAESLTDLARVLVNVGQTNDLVEAENLARQALAIRSQLADNEPVDQALALYVLGSVLQRQRKWVEAEETHREALEIRRRVLNEHPDVASSLHNLARVLRGLGRRSEAEAMLREGLAMDQKLLGNDHPDVLTFQNSLASLLNAKGTPTDAEPLAREALAMRREVYGNEHILVARALANLADVLGREGKTVEAEPLFHEALAMRRKLLGNESEDVVASLSNLAAFLHRQGRWAEAEIPLREVLPISRKLHGNEALQVAHELNLLALTQVRQGKWTEAELTARECLAIRKKKVPNNWPTFATQSLLGEILLERKNYSEAGPLLLDAYQLMEHHAPGIPDGGKGIVTETAQHLGQVYEATGQTNKAAEWKRKSTEVNNAKN